MDDVAALGKGGRQLVFQKRDMIDHESGLLKVVRDSGRRKPWGEVIWLCRCGCGNPEEVPVTTTRLLKKEKKSCGCLRGRKAKAGRHDTAEAREAVGLAIYWAEVLKTPLDVHWGYGKVKYVIHDPAGGKRCHYPRLWHVLPDGTVQNTPGYPDYPTLFGVPGGRLYIQFRYKGSAEPWTTYQRSFVFAAHQRHLAERQVQRLEAEGKDMEYRIVEGEDAEG